MNNKINDNITRPLNESTSEEQREWMQLILEDDCLNAFNTLWQVAAEVSGPVPDETSEPEKLALLAKLLEASQRYLVARASWLAGTPLFHLECEICGRFVGLIIPGVPIVCVCGNEGISQPKQQPAEPVWVKGSPTSN